MGELPAAGCSQMRRSKQLIAKLAVAAAIALLCSSKMAFAQKAPRDLAILACEAATIRVLDTSDQFDTAKAIIDGQEVRLEILQVTANVAPLRHSSVCGFEYFFKLGLPDGFDLVSLTLDGQPVTLSWFSAARMRLRVEGLYGFPSAGTALVTPPVAETCARITADIAAAQAGLLPRMGVVSASELGLLFQQRC